MKIKCIYISCFFLLQTILWFGFTDDPYNKIAAKDVVFTIPKGFPKPTYSFTGNKLSPDKFILGRTLFYDPMLSKDGTVSCGTCHQQFAAFAHIDHKLSHGIYGLIGTRNVPPLQNLLWSNTYMWDGGVSSIEFQPINPITNPIEMNESMANVILKLQQNEAYKGLFKKAFNDTIVTADKILKCLTQFTGLMISSNSKYDKYLSDEKVFSPAEKNGLSLFKQKCATCHKEPLFTDHTYKSNGLPVDTVLKDLGRGIITKTKKDNYKFKVPSLRNVEMTYPYMHDGRFRNLKQVLDFYGTINNTNLVADDKIKQIGTLTETDKEDLIAFLKTLTDKTFLYDRRFAEPYK